MSLDLAMQNFTQNTLIGNGSLTGPSNGSIGIFADHDFHQGAQTKFKSPDAFSQTLGKLVDAFQWIETISPSAMFSQFTSPPPTPFAGKLPNVLGRK